MAIVGNKLYRKAQTKEDEAANIEVQVARIEDDVRKLKIDFDIYFNSGGKRPPLEAKARLDATIKRIADNRNLTFAQRFQFNTVVSRYTAFRELWRRMLKAKGEEI